MRTQMFHVIATAALGVFSLTASQSVQLVDARGFACQTLTQIVDSTSSLSILSDALSTAGLDGTLNGGDYTLFAPDNRAFEKLAKTLQISLFELLALPNLQEILLYHVVPGTYFSSDLYNGQLLQTVQGCDLKIGTIGGVTVNGAAVIGADQAACNGVLHKINKVLIPKPGCGRNPPPPAPAKHRPEPAPAKHKPEPAPAKHRPKPQPSHKPKPKPQPSRDDDDYHYRPPYYHKPKPQPSMDDDDYHYRPPYYHKPKPQPSMDDDDYYYKPKPSLSPSGDDDDYYKKSYGDATAVSNAASKYEDANAIANAQADKGNAFALSNAASKYGDANAISNAQSNGGDATAISNAASNYGSATAVSNAIAGK